MEERYYDLVFIVRPATPEEEIKKVLAVVEHTVAEKGGKIEKTEHWGTRKLAYRVAKHREGIYVHQEIRTTHGELIAELERRLRVQDNVIKYQTVRLDEDRGAASAPGYTASCRGGSGTSRGQQLGTRAERDFWIENFESKKVDSGLAGFTKRLFPARPGR